MSILKWNWMAKKELEGEWQNGKGQIHWKENRRREKKTAKLARFGLMNE